MPAPANQISLAGGRANGADGGLTVKARHGGEIIARELAEPPRIPAKFSDPHRTADGSRRAHVSLRRLRTLWFNTGTLCNLACETCYIESSPRNDRLGYLGAPEVRDFLTEAQTLGLELEEVGFTGGEPFMNPGLPEMLAASLAPGYRVLVLTNAMRPMMRRAEDLLSLRERYGQHLTLRVSVDHHRRDLHESERGARSWAPMMHGLRWLAMNGFNVSLAGRLRWGDDADALRDGFERVLRVEGIDIDVREPERLVLFPEMDERADSPEITTDCWTRLGVRAQDMMCATSRMVVKHRGASRPTVVSCTLLPYDARFALGRTLADALGDIALNHPHCSRFCVLGGGKCSS